jgi:signal transduction histidine kinase
MIEIATAPDTVIAALPGVVEAWPVWLAVAVGFAVLLGIAGRNRAEARAAAERALRSERRASLSESRARSLELSGRAASEIHDVLAHSLTAMAVQLELADSLQEAGRATEATDAIRRARNLARRGVVETRQAISVLGSEPEPLLASLHRLADDHGVLFALDGPMAPVSVSVSASAAVSVSVSVETTQELLRDAREGIDNARRFAPGATVLLSLDVTHPDTVRLVVDNGGSDEAGDAARLPRTERLGLQAMSERVRLRDGTVAFGPPGASDRPGWRLDVRLPR